MYKSFDEDLNYGEMREKDFLSCFSNLKKGENRKVDITGENLNIELKSERYTFLEESSYMTNCLFIEYIDETNPEKKLGPWRCIQDNIDLYIHWFEDGTLFVFDPKILCEYLEKNIKKFRQVKCINERNGRKFEATGLLVPIFKLDINNIIKNIKILKKNEKKDILFLIS